MTTNDAEEQLRGRVQAALEAGPSPGRARLAAIEQSLPTDRRRRPSAAVVGVAVLVTGAAAAAGTAYWLDPWLWPPSEPGEPPTPSEGASQPNEPAATRSDDDAGESDEDAETEGVEDESRDSPIIYRR